jgi:hypothetical protein
MHAVYITPTAAATACLLLLEAAAVLVQLLSANLT